MIIGIDASRAVSATPTGTENYSRSLIKAMASCAPAGELRLYFNTSPDHDLAKALTQHELCALPAARLWTHTRLALEVVARPPDVLFVPAHVLPIARRCPAVVTIHDLGYLSFPEAHEQLSLAYLRLSTLFNSLAASHIIAPSLYTKGELVARLGVHPARVSVIAEAAASEARHNPVCADPAAHADATEPYFLVLGSVHPRKNISRLLRAFALVADRLPQRLVVAGRLGYRAEQFEAEAAQLGVAPRVTFTGYVDDHQRDELLRRATALLFISLYEGFGLPALEAMQAGTPVIASATTALGEISHDAALQVEPTSVDAIAAAMERVAADSVLRAQLRAAGLRKAQQFSWHAAAEQTLQLLRAVAGGSNQPFDATSA